MSTLAPRDFVDLAKFAHDLLERVRKFGSDHEKLNARVGVLSLVFSDLHTSLLKFTNLPKKHEKVFADLKLSCFTTLCDVEPLVRKLEKLKSDPQWKSTLKKVMHAARNEMRDINQELLDQTLLLGNMTMRINQMFERNDQADLSQKVDSLITELRAFRVEYAQNSSIRASRLETVEGISTRLKLLEPRMGYTINETFGPYLHHHEVMNRPFERREAPLAAKQSSDYYHSPSPQRGDNGNRWSSHESQFYEDPSDNTRLSDNKNTWSFHEPLFYEDPSDKTGLSDTADQWEDESINDTDDEENNMVNSTENDDEEKTPSFSPPHGSVKSGPRTPPDNKPEPKSSTGNNPRASTGSGWLAAASVPVVGAAVWFGFQYMGAG